MLRSAVSLAPPIVLANTAAENAQSLNTFVCCVRTPEPGQSLSRNIEATGSKTELLDQRTRLTPKAAERHANRDHCGRRFRLWAPRGARPPSFMEIPMSSTGPEGA